jgi:exodeoxyribonuclease-3
VAFGQETCRPVSPHCDACIIKKMCPQIDVTPRRQQKRTTVNQAKRFLSWNVNGLRAVEKKGFTELIQHLSPDIIGLQEIKAQPEQLSDTIKNIPGYTSYWYPAERKGYAGVCIYTKKEPLQVLYGLDIAEHDQEGRVLTLEFDDFFFTTCYFPNAQHGLTRLDYKLSFNRDLHTFINDLAKKKSVVLCGDFNVAHKEIDLTNPKENEKNPGFSPPERSWMDVFVKSGYLDTFRIFNQAPGNYTWWSYRFNARAKDIGWRIDYFCVDKKSKKRVLAADILKDVMGSDHCPVSIDFK